MVNSTYYQKNRDIILKIAKDIILRLLEKIREINIKIFQKKREKK